LSKPLEAAIIIMVILTTFLAPPFLRVAFKGSPEAAEVEESKEALEQADLFG
jgi:hypothetical protein